MSVHILHQVYHFTGKTYVNVNNTNTEYTFIIINILFGRDSSISQGKRKMKNEIF